MGILERKGREKEARKEEIIRAAQNVFNSKGLQEATMDEIADVAELSKGTLYLYFKSKEDLYIEFIMIGLRHLRSRFEDVIKLDEPSIKKAQKVWESYYNFFKENRNYFRSFQFFSTPQFHSQVSPEIRDICHSENEKTWRLAVNLLQQCIDDGYAKPELNPAETAVILWSSATAIMQRIDFEAEYWKRALGIDLDSVLKATTALVFGAMLTERGKKVLGEHN
jgi:AcrR family transcriptional regulator